MQQSLVYAFHGRFPDPRAAALFAATEATSLGAHFRVTIAVPTRDTTDIAAARAQFGIPADIDIIALPVLDLYRFRPLRRFSFEISLATFSCSLWFYLRKRRDASWVMATDHLVALAASLAGKSALLEIHDFPSKRNPLWHRALRSARLVLATNLWKRDELIKVFGLPSSNIFMERNGVDPVEFSAGLSKGEARARLGIERDALVAAYTGHLYAWKGVDTLLEAIRSLPDVTLYLVGGAPADVSRLKKVHERETNIRFTGYQPHGDMPMWQAAADVLILPNTAREEISSHYTSPMKLFEYMTSARPIVASSIPSIEEIIPGDAAYLVVADDAAALASGIRAALSDPEESSRRARNAQGIVAQYAWPLRAQRIADRMRAV